MLTVCWSYQQLDVKGPQAWTRAARWVFLRVLCAIVFHFTKPLTHTVHAIQQLRQVETHSPHQPGELDPSVDVTSSEVTYATVVGRRGPDAHTSVHHPVAIQTQVADPGSEDVRLLYSTVHFNREGTALQPGGKIGSAAGLSELYATVQRPRQ